MKRISSLLLFLVLAGLAFPVLAQSKDDCLACHSDASLTTERNGKTVSLFADEAKLKKSPHAKLVCVACHVGFDPNNMPHKEKITPVNCLTCHKDAPLQHTFHPQMAKANGTGGTPDVSCKSCHGTHDVGAPSVPGSKSHRANLVNGCTTCHADVKSVFMGSAHGAAIAVGKKGAPTCFDCHKNDITRARADRDSVQIKIAQEQMCLGCHADNPDVRAQMLPDAGFIRAYDQSVHGKALRGGNAKVANCVDCHGSHTMQKGNDPASPMHRANIAATCGTCHADISKQYTAGIHGEAAAKGNPEAPVCTDCHGEHNIMKANDPKSPTAAANVSAQTCSPCHSSLKMTQKYGLAGDRFQTFQDSYHGLAIKGGALEVANCASCHGAHYIRPSSDSTSTIHPTNLARTCGECHKGANDRFASGPVHAKTVSEDEPLLYWVANIYIMLIVGTIGGMFVHNLADFIRKSRRKLAIRRGELHEPHVPGHHLYLRMTASERIQHAMLLVSFITLVITGFMLRFPDGWWVRLIRDLTPATYDLRGIIHRIAAVVMIAASLFHLYYIVATVRGRQLVKDLWFSWSDLTDMVAVLKYNFGFSQEKPQFGRFSYIEKSEYWALVWGTMVMAATGFIMWFDNTFLGMIGKLGYDVARTVHYYEAWLATLAIVVWHFYYVIFNPDTYPINLAFWNGHLSEQEMAEEHPLELAELKKKELEASLNEVIVEKERKG